MLLLQRTDTQITNFINTFTPHNQFFDYFFSFFSLRGSSILIWLIVIAVVLILEERKYPGIQKRDIKFVIIFALSFAVSFITSDLILKNIFQRPRPSITLTYEVRGRLAQCPKNYSFPSSHATTAFAAATVLTNFDRKRKWFYYGFAVLISLSRLYLACHFFFDVLAGGIIGLTISYLILRFISKKRRSLKIM